MRQTRWAARAIMPSGYLRLADSLVRYLRGHVTDTGKRRALAFGQGAVAHRTLIASLVIFGILVDLPGVIDARTGLDVADGQHRRHHRMVLIVVAVHAVAADQMQRRIFRLQL